MATPAVGAACLLLARATGAPGPRRGGGGGDQARPRRPQRAVRRRCVAELSREGPAPRPMPQLAPPLVPGSLAPPRDEPEPAREPASTPPPVPDGGLGDLDLGLELEGKSGASKSCCSLLIDMCVQIAADRFVQREMRLRGLVIS